MLSEKEVEASGKLSECPLCGGKEDDEHERCFHCSNDACGYLQCCDNEGFYDKQRNLGSLGFAEE